MNDDSSAATRRRVLVHGVDNNWLSAKIRAYEDLGGPVASGSAINLRGSKDAGWVQLDIDPRMPLYHFHNLGMWMVGFSDDAVVPDNVILQSQGTLAADYWLVPQGPDSILHGRRSDGSAYAYDLAGGVVRTESNLQSPPVSARLMMVNRGVPLALIEDWDQLPLTLQLDVQLWALDAPDGWFGRLLKGFFGS